MNYKKLEGIIAATVTPVNAAGELILEGIVQHTHFLIEKGIHGLFPCGSTGEGILLSKDKRKRIAEITVKEAAGRVPVVIHSGSINISEAIELTVHARDIGADGAALVPPYYYTIDEATMLNYYRAVAGQISDFPLYIYNIPVNVKNAVSPGVVARLQSEFPNIVGLKDSSFDFMNFIKFREVLPEDFCILMGNDAQIYASLLMNSNGAVAATASVFPEPVVEIYNSFKAGNLEKALKAQKIVIKLRDILRSFVHVAPYKKALEYRGIKAGVPHSPLRDLTEEESAKLRRELESLGLPF